MDKRIEQFISAAQREDVGLEPPLEIPCMRCGGNLVATTFNKAKTLIFLECVDCKHCYTATNSLGV